MYVTIIHEELISLFSGPLDMCWCTEEGSTQFVGVRVVITYIMNVVPDNVQKMGGVPNRRAGHFVASTLSRSSRCRSNLPGPTRVA